MAVLPGNRTTFVDTDDHILDLRMGLDWLNKPVQGLAFLKRIGTNGFKAKAVKHEFTETDLIGNSETVTIDDSATTLTVADAYAYQINDIIKIDDEELRVTALATATTLTVVRGYGDTDAAAHTSKVAYNLGPADPENSAAPAGQSLDVRRLYNYVQTYSRSVDLSTDEIAQLTTAGNLMTKNVEARFVELNRLLARNLWYGQRYQDTSNKINRSGGIDFFTSTNVDDASTAALSNALIDAQIKAIVDNGGTPTVIVCSTTQKQFLDAIDEDLRRTRQSDRTGGSAITMKWQSGVLDTELDVVVDNTIKPDELWILDESQVKVGYLSNNGVNGAFAVYDATTPGTDGKKHVVRGKYTVTVEHEAGAVAKIHNLDVTL